MTWFSQKEDAELFAVLVALPSLPFASLVRPDLASVEKSKEAFFAQRKIPLFTFSKADQWDAFTYLRLIEMAQRKMERIGASEALHSIYQEKLDELRDRAYLIEAIQKKDDLAVSKLSDTLFSFPIHTSAVLIDLFHKQNALPEMPTIAEKRIDADTLSKAASTLLRFYDLKGWQVKKSPIASFKITHDFRKNTSFILIPETLAISSDRAVKLLTHEIEGHALRTENGRQSPYAIFARGLAHYTLTDEGVALHLQHSLKDLRTNYLPGLLDAIGVACAREKSFEEVFDLLFTLRATRKERLKSLRSEEEMRDIVWRQMLRLFRGIHHPDTKGAVYGRDHVYFTGHEMVHKALESGISLEMLYAGKIGAHHLPFLYGTDLSYVRIPKLLAAEALKT